MFLGMQALPISNYICLNLGHQVILDFQKKSAHQISHPSV